MGLHNKLYRTTVRVDSMNFNLPLVDADDDPEPFTATVEIAAEKEDGAFIAYAEEVVDSSRPLTFAEAVAACSEALRLFENDPDYYGLAIDTLGQ